MAGETVITVVGNLTDDPELRFTPSGAAVAGFTVASTARQFDRNTNEWKDGDPLFLRCSIWRQAAENVAESLTKGMRVVVQGRLKQRSYETREGEKRTVVELDVEEIGPSLRYATAKVTKSARGSGGGYGGQGGSGDGGGWSGGSGGGASGSGGGSFSGGGQGQSPSGGGGGRGPSGPPPQDDPWASNSGSGGGWGGGYSDEPPF
jgi:single-strand DNA-binding protein